jgi:hypothetical protein
MARVSNPKKFSLVYHELGNDARSGRGLIVAIEDLLETVALAGSKD